MTIYFAFALSCFLALSCFFCIVILSEAKDLCNLPAAPRCQRLPRKPEAKFGVHFRASRRVRRRPRVSSTKNDPARPVGGSELMSRLLKRAATAGLLAVFLLADPATPAYRNNSPTHFPFAYMQHDCAPNDAVELDLYFTAKKSECGKYSEPFVKISIWRNLPKPDSHSAEIPVRDGSAVRCLKPGACEAATSVILRLDKLINEKSSSGEYELHFKDGSAEKAKFDATSCYNYFVCG